MTLTGWFHFDVFGVPAMMVTPTAGDLAVRGIELPTRRSARGPRLPNRPANTVCQLRRPGVVMGHDGELLDETETERVRAAPGIDHGVAQHHGPGRRTGHHRAAVPGRLQRFPHLRVLQDRTQV